MSEKYGRLTVVGTFFEHTESGKKKKRVRCECDCGGKHVTCYYNLRRGNVTGCPSCSAAVRAKSEGFTHWQSKKFREENPEMHKVFSVWRGMIARCTNINNSHWHRYGGRGITVCERWIASFDNFISDMGMRPTPEHQIDRIDNDSGYSKENCRWASRKENARNKGMNRMLEINGELKCVSEWAEISGVHPDTALMRLNRGWSPKDAIFGSRHKRRYNTPDGEFKTLKEVQDFYGMSSSGVHSRFKSESFPEWVIEV